MDNPFAGTGKAAIQRRLANVDPDTVQDYIDDAWAKALSVAPCVGEETFPPENNPGKAAQLTAILRSIILRWHESGINNVTAVQAGPFGAQFGQPPPRKGFNLFPSEIVDLQRLCAKQGRPFSVDTIPADYVAFDPLTGVVINGFTETLNGPPGEWAEGFGPEGPI